MKIRYALGALAVEAWTMNLSDIFKKPPSDTDEDFLEMTGSMSEIIDLDLSAPSLDVDEDDLADEPGTSEETQSAEIPDTSDTHRLTAYAQSRLAALSAFEELHRKSDEELRQLSATLSHVQAAHHSTREFLSTMHNGVYRANELELAHAQLISENRKLSQQVEQVKRLRSQHESLIETVKRREGKLLQDCDFLKVELGRVGLEANDATNHVSQLESERADLLTRMAVTSSNAERHARENEILREKQVNLFLDLETTQRRYTEIERKLGEVTAVRETEAGQISELRSKLGAAEKEVYRRHRQFDAVSARLEEAQDALNATESRIDDAMKRHDNITEKLKTEITALKAKLDTADKAHLDWSNELGTVKQKLSEAVSEKKIAEDRLATATREFEIERKALSANSAEASNSSVQQESDSILLDVHTEEVEKLRDEIDALKKKISKRGSDGGAKDTPKARRARKADESTENDDDDAAATED